MDKTLPEIRMAILNIITDLLTDLSDDGGTDFDREERRDYFSRVSDMIAEEIGLEITNIAEDGQIQATLSPRV